MKMFWRIPINFRQKEQSEPRSFFERTYLREKIVGKNSFV